MASEDEAKAVYDKAIKHYKDMTPWSGLTQERRDFWMTEADRQAARRQLFGPLKDKLEPSVIDVSPESVWMSIAISLKRIADCMDFDGERKQNA